jgi:hypothetical protein
MMNKKLFGSIDESLKEKMRNCKDEKEMQETLKEANMPELSLDMLEGITGGIDMPELPDERIDCRGFFIS